jgi:hypothetical protein
MLERVDVRFDGPRSLTGLLLARRERLLADGLRHRVSVPDRRGGPNEAAIRRVHCDYDLTLALALPASAGAKTGDVLWLCDPEAPYSEAEEVTFVSAPAAAEHGITRADMKAGNIAFEEVGGEFCRVHVVVP